MSAQESSKSLIGISILAPVAASLCCIMPLLAIIAGSSGIASSFSWLEPARPYFIGATIITLCFAWYQKLKPVGKDDCCAVKDRPKFIQSKTFLGVVTLFAALMTTFPYYSNALLPKEGAKAGVPVNKNNLVTAEFTISGMGCSACENEVNHEVNKLNGVLSTRTSYDNGNAQVQFDSSKTNLRQIENAINSTGYKVKQSKIKS